MTRARNLGRLANTNTLSADNTNNFVGIGSTQPDARLDVDGTVLVGTAITIGGASGIVSATAFYGDGSNLDGVASAGLGTALAEEGAGSVIYYTDAVLGIGSTVIVSVPSTTSDVAYTQYATVSVDGDADLIVAEDDDFVADILGIGSDVQTPGTLTNNSRVRAARLVNSAGTGAPQLQFGAEIPVGYGLTGAGGINVSGAATIGGNLNVGGVLTYEDVTNIDSLGIITARSHVSIADSILHTGDTDTAIRFPAADTFTVETGGTEAFRVASDQKVYFGDFASAGSKAYIEKEVSGDYKLNIHASSSTSQSRVITFNSREDVEALRIDASGFVGIGTDIPNSYDSGGRTLVLDQNGTLAGMTIRASTQGSVYFADGLSGNEAYRGRIEYKHNDDSLNFGTAGTGSKLTITSTGGVHFNNAELIERVSIVANKLSAVPNVNLDNGMVHYYTTNETTTATPNIISTAGINTNMATGDTMSITIMSKPNNAGYFPKVSIDGVATGITTYWSGGSAPSSAESSGVDVNVYQIIKTADATYDVLANTSNFA